MTGSGKTSRLTCLSEAYRPFGNPCHAEALRRQSPEDQTHFIASVRRTSVGCALP